MLGLRFTNELILFVEEGWFKFEGLVELLVPELDKPKGPKLLLLLFR